MIDVERVVDEVQTGFGNEGADKRIVPIVIIYKPKKSNWESATPMSAEEVRPIILDVGKRTRRTIKALKRGRGRLMDEADEVMREYCARLGKDVENLQLVPLIMLYRKKIPRRSRPGLTGLLLKVFGQRR
jgi:hypothetical protein